jgi:putative phosphoesterase
MRTVVLSDTHLRPGRKKRLPDSAYRLLATADAILHAGDIVTADLLHELSGFAPVHAVLGNNDTDPALAHLPEVLRVELGGVPIAMVHDSGPAAGREGRMKRRFPDAAVVVFGHSHIPWDREGLDAQRLFNPGSATERRSQPHHTLGILDLDDGEVTNHEIVVLQ